jgi:hypothetical protein
MAIDLLDDGVSPAAGIWKFFVENDTDAKFIYFGQYKICQISQGNSSLSFVPFGSEP